MSEETDESIRKVGFKLGEKTPITRIEKPSGLLDATAKAPSTNDDFIGLYQAVWLPVRYEIRKDDEKYICTVQLYRADSWKTEGKLFELTSIPDNLGFVMSQREDKHISIIFNETLKRFEIAHQLGKRQSSVIRMPLARISPEDEKAAVYFMQMQMEIGVPSWR